MKFIILLLLVISVFGNVFDKLAQCIIITSKYREKIGQFIPIGFDEGIVFSACMSSECDSGNIIEWGVCVYNEFKSSI